MIDAWETHFEKTWLASAEACGELDDRLAKLVGEHRGIEGDEAIPANVLATRCTSTAALLETLGASTRDAVHCTILLAVLGELLVCAEAGGILREATVDRFAGWDARRKIEPEAIRRLRNAVCHPASGRGDDEEGGISSFADYVDSNFKDETWAADLRTKPGELARREVAFFSLRLVNNIGLACATRWKLTLKDFRNPHRR